MGWHLFDNPDHSSQSMEFLFPTIVSSARSLTMNSEYSKDQPACPSLVIYHCPAVMLLRTKRSSPGQSCLFQLCKLRENWLTKFAISTQCTFSSFCSARITESSPSAFRCSGVPELLSTLSCLVISVLGQGRQEKGIPCLLIPPCIRENSSCSPI